MQKRGESFSRASFIWPSVFASGQRLDPFAKVLPSLEAPHQPDEFPAKTCCLCPDWAPAYQPGHRHGWMRQRATFSKALMNTAKGVRSCPGCGLANRFHHREFAIRWLIPGASRPRLTCMWEESSQDHGPEFLPGRGRHLAETLRLRVFLRIIDQIGDAPEWGDLVRDLGIAQIS